jgi:hypothetical protein
MFNKNALPTLILLALFSIVGCANTPQKTASEKHRVSSIEEADGETVTNAVAMKANASDFVEIKFNKKSSSLTDEAKISLNLLVKDAKQDGNIDELIVLSWSDEEYPSKNLKKLPKFQKELAEKRNRAVEAYVKSMRIIEVNTFNMAERPNTITKLFETTNSKLKNSLLAAGLPTTADPAQYASKASHSVILIKVK